VRHRMIVPAVCAVFTAVAATGCVESSQYFRPTEHVYGETAHGFDEAIYNLVGPFGPFGEAKVWSSGAFSENGNSVLHATIELHNTSGVPIVVQPDQLRLDPVRVGAHLLRDLGPKERQALSVAPGAFGVVQLHYVLPPEVSPGQVSSFGLRWRVQNGPQSYTQHTPFVEHVRRYANMSYPPTYGYGYGYFCNPYDPFCRGPYGYGGFGYGSAWNGGGSSEPGERGGAGRQVIRSR
jgi:hypothetical protein